jgi:hypothetical protein
MCSKSWKPFWNLRQQMEFEKRGVHVKYKQLSSTDDHQSVWILALDFTPLDEKLTSRSWNEPECLNPFLQMIFQHPHLQVRSRDVKSAFQLCLLLEIGCRGVIWLLWKANSWNMFICSWLFNE